MKYEFTGETKTLDNGIILHRIRRIEDGLIGGWIEKEENLSQDGLCFVYDEAMVMDKSMIYDNAMVMDKSMIHDEVIVMGKSMIYGSAVVGGNVIIYGNSKVCGLTKMNLSLENKGLKP